MFVQVIQGRAKDPAAVRRQFEKWSTELMPSAEGFLGSTGGVSSDGEFIAVARFESEEAARRNSDRPEQGAWWSDTEGYLEDVRFQDSTDVEVWAGGGSDDAGFVQVMQGVMTQEDRARMREVDELFQKEMPKLRPDIIGGITAWVGESFTSVNYFKSEDEARAGEKKEMPSELQKGFEEWQAAMKDLNFIDLQDPFMVSP